MSSQQHSSLKVQKHLPLQEHSVPFFFLTLKKLSSRYPGTTLGTWPMVKHCKTNKQKAPQLPLLPNTSAALLPLPFPVPLNCAGALGAAGCSECGWERGTSPLSAHLAANSLPHPALPPQPGNIPGHAQMQPQTPARQPWVHQRHQRSLAWGGY